MTRPKISTALRLRTAIDQLRVAADELDSAVIAARLAGHSWQDIAARFYRLDARQLAPGDCSITTVSLHYTAVIERRRRRGELPEGS